MWPILALALWQSSWVIFLSATYNHRTYFQRLFIEELNVNTGAHCHLTLSCCHCQHLDLCGLKEIRDHDKARFWLRTVFLLLTWFDHFLIFAWHLEVPITKENCKSFYFLPFAPLPTDPPKCDHCNVEKFKFHNKLNFVSSFLIRWHGHHVRPISTLIGHLNIA